jgi:hypothetical protein
MAFYEAVMKMHILEVVQQAAIIAQWIFAH